MIDRNDIKKILKNIYEIKNQIIIDKKFGFDLPFNEFIDLMRLLSPQQRSVRIESYYREKFNFLRSNNQDRGDFTQGNEYFEFKQSIIDGINNTVNFVQIREWQDVNYLFIVLDVKSEPYKEFFFKLTKKQMMNELAAIGTSAHGTRTANINNETQEKAIRFKLHQNDKTFNRWINNYLA